MKNIILATLTLFAAIPAEAGRILLEGKYQNKNLYVQNGFASSGAGFCVYEVKVNGEVTTDEVNSSAFEIDLAQRNLSPGEEVVIEIRHKDGCSPKVLNPDALRPSPTFQTASIEVNPQGLLTWTTTSEAGSLPYIVEQFKWNKWVSVGEVSGTGKPTENKYNFKVPLTSGLNRFRVRQTGLNNQVKYSPETKVQTKLSPIEFSYDKKTDIITFTGETDYEVYDQYGNLVKKGYGKTLDVSNLEKSVHYLNYDTRTSEFNKK